MTSTQQQVRNILLIEDDDDTRLTLKAELSEEGYSVRTAIDRDEAQQHLNRALFQVILMDLCMPGKAAHDFIALVRKKCPQSKIILMTAINNVAPAAARLGIAYIGKPFTHEALIGMLQTVDQP